MNARLTRPLLAVVVGALLAGGAGAAPALADTGRDSVADAAAVLGDEPADTPSTPAPEPTTPEPSTPAPDPSTPTEDPSTPTEDPSTPTQDPSTPTEDPSTPTQDPSTPTEDPSTPTQDPSTPPVTPPAPDKTAPKGAFSLNTTSLWAGQKVTFTQGSVTDNTTPWQQITRSVSWGDGTSTTLRASGQAPVNKLYAKNGKYTVTLSVKDAAGNVGKATKVVTVTTPGKWKLDKTSLWSGQKVKITLSGVPAGTTKINFNWGDGYTNWVKPKNQSFTGLYYHRKNGGLVKGKITLKATFYNKYGATSAYTVATVTLKTDSWAPVVKVKKPASSNRIKSWKTVTGTVSDKGSGVPYVYVFVSRISGSKVYCYTPQKKWKRVYTETDYNNCVPIAVKPAKGKWSVKVNGLAKGTIYVDAIAWDWADKQSKWSSVKAKLTRS
ncbi:PKD domain-containing protein [Actinoplanes sp. TFC3]|uniref:PKD domain-containing protein n=1 Tax=Actinoplanes sp. TFC3 TaxID=1710355 RepID=UPI000830F02F|nr:PKD domain-containing protein [Actinoplanes sp. TFC3]